ncbi:putative transcriptional regulator [Ceratocystis lukuohia]|uniref:Transcriptional regulator n=1 Tax=Ceratocystis lukuohia TaxID=2019550 RepID=A0ABR4MPY8_9PEZI
MRSRSINFMVNDIDQVPELVASSPTFYTSFGSSSPTPTTPRFVGGMPFHHKSPQSISDMESLATSVNFSMMATSNSPRRVLSISEMLQSPEDQSPSLQSILQGMASYVSDIAPKTTTQSLYAASMARASAGSSKGSSESLNSRYSGAVSAYSETTDVCMDMNTYSIYYDEPTHHLENGYLSPQTGTSDSHPHQSPLMQMAAVAVSVAENIQYKPLVSNSVGAGSTPPLMEKSPPIIEDARVKEEENRDLISTPPSTPPSRKRRSRARGKDSLEQAVSCDLCSRGGFAQKSELKKTHTRPHACPGCDMTFATLRDMRRHAHRHQEVIMVWQCNCGVTFTRDYNLRRHLRCSPNCKASGKVWTANHGGRPAPVTKGGFSPDATLTSPSTRSLSTKDALNTVYTNNLSNADDNMRENT